MDYFHLMQVIRLVFHVASVVACSWLLWKVGSNTGGRLLPVQLVNLALADLLYSTGEAWNICVTLGGGSGIDSRILTQTDGGVHGRPHCGRFPRPLLAAAENDTHPQADHALHVVDFVAVGFSVEFTSALAFF